MAKGDGHMPWCQQLHTWCFSIYYIGRKICFGFSASRAVLAIQFVTDVTVLVMICPSNQRFSASRAVLAIQFVTDVTVLVMICPSNQRFSASRAVLAIQFVTDVTVLVMICPSNQRFSASRAVLAIQFVTDVTVLVMICPSNQRFCSWFITRLSIDIKQSHFVFLFQRCIFFMVSFVSMVAFASTQCFVFLIFFFVIMFFNYWHSLSPWCFLSARCLHFYRLAFYLVCFLCSNGLCLWHGVSGLQRGQSSCWWPTRVRYKCSTFMTGKPANTRPVRLCSPSQQATPAAGSLRLPLTTKTISFSSVRPTLASFRCCLLYHLVNSVALTSRMLALAQ